MHGKLITHNEIEVEIVYLKCSMSIFLLIHQGNVL